MLVSPVHTWLTVAFKNRLKFIFFFLLSSQAVDQDTQKSVEYKFLTGDHRFFDLQPDGTIRTSQALDYETINVYVFQVTTVDGETSNIASATATVSVRVQVRHKLHFKPNIHFVLLFFPCRSEALLFVSFFKLRNFTFRTRTTFHLWLTLSLVP